MEESDTVNGDQRQRVKRSAAKWLPVRRAELRDKSET
jgi:hypothetical protein